MFTPLLSRRGMSGDGVAGETSSIKVLVRVRPLRTVDGRAESEAPRHVAQQSHVVVGTDGEVQVLLPKTLRNPREEGHSFRFDDVAPPEATQEDVFEKVGREATNAFLDGFNAAVFAYGQTGSGKTYTMYGEKRNEAGGGLIPRSLHLIFSQLDEKIQSGSSVTCRLSLTEIYNEQVVDLLNLNRDARALQLRENPLTGNVYVEGAKVVAVHSVDDTLELVDAGLCRRVVAATGCNDHSSRSHVILTLHLGVEETLGGTRVLRTSCLHLIDLAGSERQCKAKSVGQRLKEASNINRSLSVLSNVILHLAEGHTHVPYRDSKLTFLLRNSLGGNSKTFVVANVSGEAGEYHESVSTLKFASFATKSQQLVTRNQVSKDPDMDQLKQEVARLHALLQAGRHEAQSLADEVATPKRAMPCSCDGDHRGGGPMPTSGRCWTSGEGESEDGQAAKDKDDRETVKRLQVLLWQACEREEKLREKVARERAGFRSKIQEYERVCTALANALETTRKQMRSLPPAREGEGRKGALAAEASIAAPQAGEPLGMPAAATEAQELADCGEAFDLAAPSWRPLATPGATRSHNAGGDEGYALLQARMKIRELEDQLSEAHGDLALEASSEKVELDRHVRELAEEMKRLLVENMQLQQGVAPTLAAGDGHARLEEEMQASQRQLAEQKQLLWSAEESLKEMRLAEEHWMLAVSEAEERVRVEEDKSARLAAELAELKLAEESFHATIAELGEELDRLRGVRQQLADNSTGRDPQCSPAPEPLPHPEPQPMPSISTPPTGHASKPMCAQGQGVKTDEANDASLAATLARKEYEVSVLLKKLAGLTKDAQGAGDKCRGLECQVAALEVEGERLRAECTELADDSSEKQLRVGVLEAEVASLRDALQHAQAAGAGGRSQDTATDTREDAEALDIGQLLVEVQSLRDEVEHLKAANDALNAAQEELVQAGRKLEEMQARADEAEWKLSQAEAGKAVLQDQVALERAGEEVRRMRQESKEAIDRIRRENEELLEALGGVSRQRDEALREKEEYAKAKALALREQETYERAREDGCRALLQVKKAEEQYQIAVSDRQAAESELQATSAALARQMSDAECLDRMLADADAKHADALHEAAEIERVLESMASTLGASETLLLLVQQQQQQQSRNAGTLTHVPCAATRVIDCPEGGESDRMGPMHRSQELHQREAPAHEEADESAAACHVVASLRKEAEAQREAAEAKIEQVEEEARIARRELSALRETLQTSACCRHVREMLQDAEEREVVLKERERQGRLACDGLQHELSELRNDLDAAVTEGDAVRQELAQCKRDILDMAAQVAASERARDTEARRTAEVDARQQELQALLDQQRVDAASREEELLREAQALRSTAVKLEGDNAALQSSLDVAQQRILDSAVASSKLRLEFALGASTYNGGPACSDENACPNTQQHLMPKTPRNGSAVPGRHGTPVKELGGGVMGKHTAARSLQDLEAELEGARAEVAQQQQQVDDLKRRLADTDTGGHGAGLTGPLVAQVAKLCNVSLTDACAALTALSTQA